MNILIVGDSFNGFSGLSNVSSNLLKYCYDKGHNTSYYTVTNKQPNKDCYLFFGEEFKDCFYDSNIYYYKNDNFDSVISEIKPDVVITIHDAWRIPFIKDCSTRHKFTWINWCLFETDNYPNEVMHTYKSDPRTNIRQVFENADLNIAVTKMGMKALNRYNLQNVHNENIHIGCDMNKICKQPKTKKEVFGNFCKEDDFVFMSVAKNLERKKLDLVIDAFALFLENKKDKSKFKFYLHTDINQFSGGTDLGVQIASKGLSSNFSLPVSLAQGKHLATQNLYEKYSACDCYVGLPAAEGFGLPFLEALLHNKPVIYSDHGGHTEYCDVYGIPVKIDHFYNNIGMYNRQAYADIEDAAKAMNEIYEGRLKKVNSFDLLKDKFDWNNVLDNFMSVVEQTVEKNEDKFRFKRIV